MTLDATQGNISYVYAMGHYDGPQKVGFSGDPTTRALTLIVGVREVSYGVVVDTRFED